MNSSGIANGTAFPAIPDQNTFVNQGLNARPTFFGCNSTNSTGPTGPSPLIVYLPNTPWVTYSNVSTFHYPSYNDSWRDLLIENGYDSVTMGNGTSDSNWSTCVGCAILSRSFDRTNTDIPQACTQCFQSYCWDGTVNSTTPATYEPTTALKNVDLDSAAPAIVPTMSAFVVTVAVALFTMT